MTFYKTLTLPEISMPVGLEYIEAINTSPFPDVCNL